MVAADSGDSVSQMLARAMAFDFAHRGLFTPFVLPENSLGAASEAMSRGFGIECDVRITRDGVVCVFHDDDLMRMTGVSGCFEEFCYDDIRELRLDRVESEKIPTLRELLSLLGGKVPLVIELKSFDEKGWHQPGMLENGVLECLASYHGDALLKSFNPKSVQRLQELRHGAAWPIGSLAADFRKDGDFQFLNNDEAIKLSRLDTVSAHQSDFISYSVQDLTPELRFHPLWATKPWMVWTVRSPELFLRARALKSQVVFERGVVHLLGDRS